jgi:hypothetical protein
MKYELETSHPDLQRRRRVSLLAVYVIIFAAGIWAIILLALDEMEGFVISAVVTATYAMTLALFKWNMHKLARVTWLANGTITLFLGSMFSQSGAHVEILFAANLPAISCIFVENGKILSNCIFIAPCGGLVGNRSVRFDRRVAGRVRTGPHKFSHFARCHQIWPAGDRRSFADRRTGVFCQRHQPSPR